MSNYEINIGFVAKREQDLNKYLKFGSHGEPVKRLQKILLALGFDPGPIDGYFGFRTEDALKKFQASTNNLKETGIFDFSTQTQINRDQKTVTPQNREKPEPVIAKKANFSFPEIGNPRNFKIQFEPIRRNYLQLHSKSSQVEDLKHNLYLLGFLLPEQINDDFDTETKEALLNFQNSNQLIPNGIFCFATQKELSEKLTLPVKASKTKSPKQINQTFNDDYTDVPNYLARGTQQSKKPQFSFGGLSKSKTDPENSRVKNSIRSLEKQTVLFSLTKPSDLKPPTNRFTDSLSHTGVVFYKRPVRDYQGKESFELYILTCNHVPSYENMKVTFSNSYTTDDLKILSHRTFKSSLPSGQKNFRGAFNPELGHDDLAVIAVTVPRVTYYEGFENLKLADRNPKKGTPVFAIGFPSAKTTPSDLRSILPTLTRSKATVKPVSFSQETKPGINSSPLLVTDGGRITGNQHDLYDSQLMYVNGKSKDDTKDQHTTREIKGIFASGGSSGGPVFQITPDGKPTILGVISRVHKKSPSQKSMGMAPVHKNNLKIKELVSKS